jgi:hypothetical protein
MDIYKRQYKKLFHNNLTVASTMCVCVRVCACDSVPIIALYTDISARRAGSFLHDDKTA